MTLPRQSPNTLPPSPVSWTVCTSLKYSLPSFLKSFAQDVRLDWNILFPTNFSYDPLGRDITYVRNASSNRASLVSTADVYLLSCCEIIAPCLPVCLYSPPLDWKQLKQKKRKRNSFFSTVSPAPSTGFIYRTHSTWLGANDKQAFLSPWAGVGGECDC